MSESPPSLSLQQQLQKLVKSSTSKKSLLPLEDSKQLALACRKKVHQFAYLSTHHHHHKKHSDNEESENTEQQLEEETAESLLSDATTTLRLLGRTLIEEINNLTAKSKTESSSSSRDRASGDEEPQPRDPNPNNNSTKKSFALHSPTNSTKVPAVASGWRDSSSSSCASSNRQQNNNNNSNILSSSPQTPLNSSSKASAAMGKNNNSNNTPPKDSTAAILNERKLVLAMIMNNLACALFIQKDFAGASVTLSQAAKLEKEISSSSSSSKNTKQHQAAVTTLGNLIAIWNNKRNYGKGVEVGREAMKLVDELEFEERSFSNHHNDDDESDSSDEDNDQRENSQNKKNQKVEKVTSRSYPIAVVRYNFGAAILGSELNRDPAPSIFEKSEDLTVIITSPSTKTKTTPSKQRPKNPITSTTRSPASKRSQPSSLSSQGTKTTAKERKISQQAINYYQEFDRWGLNLNTRDALKQLRRARDDALRIVKKAKMKREFSSSANSSPPEKTQLEKDARLLIKNIDATVQELVKNAEEIQEWKEFFEETERKLEQEKEAEDELDDEAKRLEKEYLAKLQGGFLLTSSPEKGSNKKNKMSHNNSSARTPMKTKPKKNPETTKAYASTLSPSSSANNNKMNGNEYTEINPDDPYDFLLPPANTNVNVASPSSTLIAPTTISSGLKLPPIVSPKFNQYYHASQEAEEQAKLLSIERSKKKREKVFRHKETGRTWLEQIRQEVEDNNDDYNHDLVEQEDGQNDEKIHHTTPPQQTRAKHISTHHHHHEALDFDYHDLYGNHNRNGGEDDDGTSSQFSTARSTASTVMTNRSTINAVYSSPIMKSVGRRSANKKNPISKRVAALPVSGARN